MQASELELHRQLVEQSPTMLWRARADGTWDYVNRTWQSFTGCPLAEAIEKGCSSGVHPDDVPFRLASWRALFERREPFEREYRLRRHDGVYRWVLERAAPFTTPDGAFAGFLGSCLDVDESRTGAASGATEFFEMSLDNLVVAGVDGWFKRLNPSWARTLGWSVEELLSKPVIEWVHPDDRESVLAWRAQLTAGVPLRGLVSRYRHRDGSYRTFEWNVLAHVERGLIYGIARDVTEQQETRRRLVMLTEGLATILNSLVEGVVAVDAAGLVSRMNPVAESLTGWTLEEALGVPLGRVLRVLDGQTRAPLEPTVAFTEDAVLIGRDGSERPIAGSRAPMRDAEGLRIGEVVVFRDMTAQRQAEEVRKQLQRQLILADRLASVGTLAAGVAHEINNPLTATMGNLELLTSELRRFEAGTLPARASSWTDMALDAREGADRIRRIVGGLRSFSRAEDERRAIIDVKPVLEFACHMTSNEIRHRARLVKEYGALPSVEADDGRLGQVFINLLVNAAQALPEGHGDAHEVRISAWTDEQGRAVIEVADTGPGIPEQLLGRVFDPFFTTKPIGVGTGLGLSICHTIVNGMGGSISARNRAGGGAVIRVVLPPALSDLDPSASSPAVERTESGPRARVLVIDDEPSVGFVMRRMLHRHDVTVVETGREALGRVLSEPAFDVIVSDLMMPEMSGMELYETLLRVRPDAARNMVFVTGGAFTAPAQAFLERVPNERLFKPFDQEHLLQIVEASLERSRSRT